MLTYLARFAVILYVLLGGFNSNAQLLEKKEQRLKNTLSHEFNFLETRKLNKPIPTKTGGKSPLLAGTLSFIVPGAALGQLYNGQYVNFGVRLGISGIVVLGFALSGGLSFERGNDAIIPLALLYAANWITSIIDAAMYDKKHYSGK